MSHQATFSVVEASLLQATIDEKVEKPYASKACYLDVWDRGACCGSKVSCVSAWDRGACCQVNWKEVLSQDAKNKGYDNVKEEFLLSSVLVVEFEEEDLSTEELLLGTDMDSGKMIIIPLPRGVKDIWVTSVIIPIFLYVDKYWRHKYGSQNEWWYWKHMRFKEKWRKTAFQGLQKRSPE